jgi:hypothetical protein
MVPAAIAGICSAVKVSACAAPDGAAPPKRPTKSATAAVAAANITRVLRFRRIRPNATVESTLGRWPPINLLVGARLSAGC